MTYGNDIITYPLESYFLEMSRKNFTLKLKTNAQIHVTSLIVTQKFLVKTLRAKMHFNLHFYAFFSKGMLFGLSNTMATIPGIVAPYIVGLITTHVSIYY